MNTTKPYAIVSDRTFLESHIEDLSKSNFYLTPETVDASFGVDQIAIAITKNSQWKNKLNPM